MTNARENKYFSAVTELNAHAWVQKMSSTAH